jgi:hypothetical protein
MKPFATDALVCITSCVERSHSLAPGGASSDDSRRIRRTSVPRSSWSAPPGLRPLGGHTRRNKLPAAVCTARSDSTQLCLRPSVDLNAAAEIDTGQQWAVLGERDHARVRQLNAAPEIDIGQQWAVLGERDHARVRQLDNLFEYNAGKLRAVLGQRYHARVRQPGADPELNVGQ